MQTIRRWYIFLVCAISLNVVAWALIDMLRTFFNADDNPAFTFALPIAVTIIGLPLYLVHWLWAQRLATNEREEQESLLRQVYLYGMMVGFLIPLLLNGYDLLSYLMGRGMGLTDQTLGIFSRNSDAWQSALIDRIAVLIVLAPLWGYHWWVAGQETKTVLTFESASTLRRIYLLTLAFVGVLTVITSVSDLLLTLFRQFGDVSLSGTVLRSTTTFALARLLIGIPLWLLTWIPAQQFFARSDTGERDSAFRKFYLYALIFIAVMATTLTVGGVLAAFLMNLMGVSPDGDLRETFATLIPMAILWGYHAFVLRQDEQAATEAPRQATIRRIYLYLVAGVGLFALLGGIIGIISALIQWIDGQLMDDGLRSQIAVATAAIIIGLPVWLFPWQRAQTAARAVDGEAERRSLVRRVYLYLYLFFATIAVLGSAIYTLSRLLSLVLGEQLEGSLLTDIAQSLAFVLIGVGVWAYHGTTLRGDGQRSQQIAIQRVADWRVVILDEGEQPWVQALGTQIKALLPSIVLDIVSVLSSASSSLATANLIVAPVSVFLRGSEEVNHAIRSSTAQKLLLPTQTEGVVYVGVEQQTESDLIKEAIATIQTLAQGEIPQNSRRMSAGAIVGSVLLGIVGVILLLIIIAFVLLSR